MQAGETISVGPIFFLIASLGLGFATIAFR